MSKTRRNFLPSFVAACFFWVMLAVLVLRSSPSSFLVIPFFFLFFLALFLTTSLILGNSRYGFLVTGFMTMFLFFAYHDLASLLNIILLSAIFIVLGMILRR